MRNWSYIHTLSSIVVTRVNKHIFIQYVHSWFLSQEGNGFVWCFSSLDDTQSSLQYSFTFTQSHTHSYSASISGTLLFYEAQFRGFSILLKDTLACRFFGKTGDRTADLQVGGRPLYPLSHSRRSKGTSNTEEIALLEKCGLFCDIPPPGAE